MERQIVFLRRAHFYLRDKERTPFGCVAVGVRDEALYVAVSIQNSCDIWNTKKAINMAYGRLVNANSASKRIAVKDDKRLKSLGINGVLKSMGLPTKRLKESLEENEAAFNSMLVRLVESKVVV